MNNFTLEYFYSNSLLTGAVVNIVLAVLLIAGTNNDKLAQLPAYRRSRYLTAGAMLVFAAGFLLHWAFDLRATSPILATALSMAYFHLGGTLLSLSHTSLAYSRYWNKKKLTRDLSLVGLSLACYAIASITNMAEVLYFGIVVSVSHLAFLAYTFYHYFQKTYYLLGNLAEFRHVDHEIDRSIRWMYFGCHLIILFGVGGALLTANGSQVVSSTNLMLRFTILMGCSIVVFSYIYLTLSNFGLVASLAQKDLKEAIAFAETEEGRECLQAYKAERKRRTPLGRFSFFTGFYRQW